MGERTWMYRKDAFGRRESRIFDAGEIPEGEGWVDTPAKLGEQEKKDAADTMPVTQNALRQ